ncbi:helicase [Paramecium bursaria Chlorella virus MA1E]|nr:helicase [Paramecium bursaria Chlorella virus MA1E]
MSEKSPSARTARLSRSKSPSFKRSVVKKPLGIKPLPARRRFGKSPVTKTPSKTTDKETIPQPKDHRFAQGETVIVYFDDRAKKIIGVYPWKSGNPPLSKVSTYGKIIQASSSQATVAFQRPSGSFSARLKGTTPMSVNGGVPLFALLNSNFVPTEVERFQTKSTAGVGNYIKVYFDPISGEAVEGPTMYSVQGKIVKPGIVEAPKPEIKTVVVRGNLPVGKRVELFVDNGKTSLKRMSEASVRVPGTVLSSKDGVSTLSYMMPMKTSGQYVQRYSPTDVTGKLVTDPRFVRRLSPEQQRQIAMYKPPTPPLCVAETFNPRASNNCFVKGMEERLKPIIQLKSKFKGTAGSGNGNPFCDLSNPKIQAHQMAVYEYARILASRSPKEIGGIRGMLCYHSVGSGKTATSMGIALAFWNTKRNIVLATTPENNNDNNASVYAENLFKFYPEQVKMVFKDRPLPEFTRPPFNRQVSAFGKTMSAGDALKAWCSDKKNITPVSNRIKTFSFTTLASALGFQGAGAVGRGAPDGEQLLMGKHGRIHPASKKGDSKAIGSVLIMDEVQSLFKPSGNSQDYIKAANWLRTELTQAKYKRYMYVFALTGTPGGSVKDILSVVNFVRPLNVPRIKPQDLNKHPDWLKGYISYVELRGDTTVYGKKNVRNIFSEMDPKYYAGFLKSVKTLTEKDLNAEKRPGFMKKAIGAGDALTTKEAIKGVYTPEEIERLMRRDMTGGVPAAVKFGPKLSILSPKLRDVINRVLSANGKQYIYVINPATAFTLMAMFDTIGFSAVHPKNPAASMSSTGKRYVFYKTGSYTYKGKKFEVEKKELNGIKKALASPANINGDYIKILIATGTFYQGLDTPGLTGVHIVDPLHDTSADIQAVGRALRMCGHRLSKSKEANVYRYFSTVPRTFAHDGIAKKSLPELERLAKKILSLNLSADMSSVNGPPGKLPPGVNSYVFADAVRRGTPVVQTENLLKAMAVDCQVFKNVFHSNQNFQCGKPVFVNVESSKSPRTPAKRTKSGLIELSPLTKVRSGSKSASGSRTSSGTSSRSGAKLKQMSRYSPGGKGRYGTAPRPSPISKGGRRVQSAPGIYDTRSRVASSRKIRSSGSPRGVVTSSGSSRGSVPTSSSSNRSRSSIGTLQTSVRSGRTGSSDSEKTLTYRSPVYSSNRTSGSNKSSSRR